MPAPYNIMSTVINLVVDYIAAAAMQGGGLQTAIAALAREGVTERSMFITHSTAVEVSRIPKQIMHKEISAILKDNKGAYDKCNSKLKRICVKAITDGEIEKIIKKALPKQANQDSVVKQLADSFKEMLEDIKKPTDEVLIDLETKKPKRKREEGKKEGASSLTSLASSPLEPAVLSVPVAAEPENYLAGLGHDEDNEDNNVTAAEEAVSRSSKRQRKDPSKFDD